MSGFSHGFIEDSTRIKPNAEMLGWNLDREAFRRVRAHRRAVGTRSNDLYSALLSLGPITLRHV